MTDKEAALQKITHYGDVANLPEVLDVLIVGGGPGGTAAAFRARELGIKALIIDYDDLMKRIRDYSKDKLILPDFGGGDKMKFPKGGDLLSCLYFAPIDKDDMCTTWKGYHQKHGIPSLIGLELTGLKRHASGIYEVLCWNHNKREAQSFMAKHVIVAIGHGVPRRFDIPGNTEGIAFRLTDPARYVGQPACVIGGGTSAAEAAIAISHAKAAAGDKTAVYWSYRGDRLPRVSKALAEVFFEAYIGNGNVRYCPLSEPAAVVTAGDHQEYLAVRVDRRNLKGRPNETVHLEFPKECCVACIGEDVPEGLLNSMGIFMATGGPRNKKRMVVNRYLETRQPNVYFVGDILSQAYFETDDFDADPATFREIKHRGNIKSALRDGVYVTEVIKQRLGGKTDIKVVLEDVEGPPVDKSRLPAMNKIPVAKPRPAATPAAKPKPEPPREAFLLRVLPGGVGENEYALNQNGITTIGRSDSDINIPEDTLLSKRHASITHKGDAYFLSDGGSASGTFLKIEPAAKMKVEPGDLIRAGRQFLLMGGSPGHFWFNHYDHTGKEMGRHPIPMKTIVAGREAPDVTLAPKDMTLSRRHLAITQHGGKIIVKDLKSANGTFLRVKRSIIIEHGAHFQVGQQKFLLSLQDDAVLDTGFDVASGPPTTHLAVVKTTPGTAAPPKVTPGGPSVTFKDLGKTFPVAPGQTLCEVAEANGIPIVAECHAGICGSDPIRVLSGRENMTAEPDDQETETLEDICELEPGPCRLACKARIKGPVTVEIIEN